MFKRTIALLMLLGIAGIFARPVSACGGLFCQNSPVDQNAERIIFSQNSDGTITSLIEIQFTGFAPDFSWILPLPSPITAEDVAVPETGMDALDEIQRLTNPVIIPPARPRCAESRNFSFGASAPDMVMESASDVQLFATGEVGPYGFDVIGSEDPSALISWLRENEYRVTEPMEPLINFYVENRFVFLAMQLLPNEQVGAIQPIEVTYAADRPMIPLKLTAVAANPNMGVYVWFFAEKQAIPVNYAEIMIADSEMTFFTSGGNNYRTLVGQKADEFGGQGFITEFAAPAHELGFADRYLQAKSQRLPYLTRLYTQISPEEMTVDPLFDYDPQRRDVSNVRDLSDMSGLWDCEKDQAGSRLISFPVFGAESTNDGTSSSSNGQTTAFRGGLLTGVGVTLGSLLLLSAGIFIGRRRKG